ncbi:PREDICTED: ligand-dependent nuclear receptor-interacting factor 1 isoform X3 [Galeopterus variegatus]|nr:PREDICTED: ligand-dependent nuclear receptor-interacting factor 1 isoform X3 [Galeopterus variegatus]
MASTLEKGIQERNNKKDSQGRSSKALYLKSDAEFKKIFGLTKDVRVCLSRIPDHLGSGEGFDSFNSLVKSGTYKETEFVVKKEERKQSFDKKRKVKTIKKMDHTKKRKTENAYNTVNVSSSQLLSSILPTPDVSQHNILTNRTKTRGEKRSEKIHYTHEKQEKGTLSSNAAFEQSHSFNKNYTEDIFPVMPPDLEETIRDEKIRRLKQVLREKEAALDEMRKKMHQK